MGRAVQIPQARHSDPASQRPRIAGDRFDAGEVTADARLGAGRTAGTHGGQEDRVDLRAGEHVVRTTFASNCTGQSGTDVEHVVATTTQQLEGAGCGDVVGIGSTVALQRAEGRDTQRDRRCGGEGVGRRAVQGPRGRLSDDARDRATVAVDRLDAGEAVDAAVDVRFRAVRAPHTSDIVESGQRDRVDHVTLQDVDTKSTREVGRRHGHVDVERVRTRTTVERRGRSRIHGHIEPVAVATTDQRIESGEGQALATALVDLSRSQLPNRDGVLTGQRIASRTTQNSGDVVKGAADQRRASRQASEAVDRADRVERHADRRCERRVIQNCARATVDVTDDVAGVGQEPNDVVARFGVDVAGQRGTCGQRDEVRTVTTQNVVRAVGGGG